ncbi:MAG: type VI secretion system tip protein VgrG, partial [Polyangiaceae bacterium]|nr:type VI secretion system tip protein VgrG [Polyangiaceae bacterium]
ALSLPRGAEPPDPDLVVGTRASLRMERAGPVRSVDGIVTDFRVRATARGTPELELVLEPCFALTRLRRDLCIFRNRSVPEIVVEVLAGHGISPALRLRGSYAQRPYTVQFRETDHDFVSRLLEDEGIFYFFLEGDLMVLGDAAAAYEAIAGIPALPFRPASGEDRHDDAVFALGRRARLAAGKVTLRDFNPAHPSLDMDVSAPAASHAGGPELYDFPGEYEQPAEGSRRAELWGEAIRCAAGAFEGTSSTGRLFPGGTFELYDAPPGIADARYVITRVEHAWHRADTGFSLAFQALDGTVDFRPPRVTPAPVILNPVTGIVTGPAGDDDIYTDAVGRVKVHFHWDRRLPYDDDCSHWVPVLQDNTGQSMSIPRIGWEVLVHFLEGDPDRPVVLGRVFNAGDRYHQPLPENKTQSMLKSLSSPREKARDASGTNEILFEDLAGREYIQIYAERDQRIVVGHDKTERVLSNETSIVKRDESIAIGTDAVHSVAASVVLTTNGNQTISVGGAHERTVTGAEAANIGKNHALSVAGLHSRRISGNDVAAAKVLTEKVGGVILEASLKGNLWSADKAGALVVGGAIVEVAKNDKSEVAGRLRRETVGGLLFVRARERVETRADEKRTTNVGGSLRVSAAKELLLAAQQKVAMTAPTVALDGKKEVTLKVGESRVVMKDGTISITTKSQITLAVSGENNQGAGKSTQI